MATNPRAKTPNDAALSAVEEALRLDFGGPGDDSERATKRPPEPRAPEAGRAAAATDAARRSELQRRPENPRMPAPPRRKTSSCMSWGRTPTCRRSAASSASTRTSR